MLKRYMPYKIPALISGIQQADDDIVRFEAAIKKAHATKEEFSTALALCRQRDKELVELGVELIR